MEKDGKTGKDSKDSKVSKVSKDSREPALRFKGFEREWEERKLGELGDTYSGLSGKMKSDFGHGDARYITYLNVFANPITDPKMTEPIEIDSKQNEVEIGDVFFTTSSETPEEVGMSSVLLEKQDHTYLNSFCFGYRPSIDIDKHYLAYMLRSKLMREQITFLAQGISRYNISKNKVMEISVPLPSPKEQMLIGQYLSYLDRLISLQQQKLNKLEEFKKAMLDKMFPQKGSRVPEIRFQGFTEPWEEVVLSKLVSQVTRNEPSSEAPIMMITANDGFIDQSERYNFNNAGESLKKYILLKKGELAYNHGASKLRPYGSCFALTNEDYARIPFVYHCFSTDTQNPEFLSFVLNGQSVMSQLRKIISSGARMDGLLNISFDDYTSLSISIPTKKEQNQIVLYFSQLDRLISLHRQKLEKLQSLKKAMLEQMFPAPPRQA